MPTPPPLPPSYAAENSSPALFATCIAFLALETTFMLLHYTSRFLSPSKPTTWTMTALMTAAYIVCLGKITIGLLSISIGGAGQHLRTLSPTTIITALKLNTALQLLCPLTTSLTKLSILSLFHTLFALPSPRYTLVIRTTSLLVLLTALVQLLIPLLNCRPFPSTWALHAPPSACAIPGLYLWKYLSIPNVVTTLVMVCIPVPALWKLRVSGVTKVGLGGVLGLSVCGVGAAVMRFASFLAVGSFDDFTYEQVGPLCWTVGESGVYLVAGVVLTLRPLVGRGCGGRRFGRGLEGGFREGGSEVGRRRGKIGRVEREKGFDELGTEDTVKEGDAESRGWLERGVRV